MTRQPKDPLPHNVAAETAVLGAMLIDPQAVLDVMALLQPDDFHLVKHRHIYAALCDLYHQEGTFDFLTLTTLLEQRQQLVLVGGGAYITELLNMVPSAAHIAQYAQRVKDTAIRRRALEFASHVARLAYDEQRDILEILDTIQTEAFALHQRLPVDRLQALSTIMQHVYDDLLAAQQGSSPLITTGYPDLDKLLGGWRPGALYTIGASTGQGKTALLLNMATAAAKKEHTVLIFSLEMSSKSLAERLLVADAGISLIPLQQASSNSRTARQENMTELTATITDACGEIAEWPIWIDDTPAITIPTLRAQVKRFAMRHPLDLMLVDYLQLVRLGRSVKQRYLEVGLISQELKRLAREINIPIIAAAQLSRAVTHRADKRPQLSDLRESGNIEQDSDAVMLIHRQPGDISHTPATLILGKNRNGPTGDVTLLWLSHKISFVSMLKTPTHHI